MKRSLLPHQAKALRRVAGLDSVAFFLEQRLGKTLLAIRWAEGKLPPFGGRVVVVASLTVLGSWESELKKESIPFVKFHGPPKKRKAALADGLERGAWILTTYGLAKTPEVYSKTWDVAIWDESTACKDPKTVVYKKAALLSKNSRCRAILTGTPAPEETLDLWPQLSLLFGGEFMGFRNFWAFRDASCLEKGYAWEIRPRWRAALEEETARHAVTITREDVGIGSTKEYRVVTGEAPPIVVDKIKKMIKTRQRGLAVAKTPLTLMIWIRQILSGDDGPDGEWGRYGPTWKFGALLEEAKRGACVVYFQHLLAIRRAHQYLRRAGVASTWLCGQASPQERAARIAAFQAGARDVMLAHPRVTRHGVDLSRADSVVYWDAPWSAEDRRQSEDRIVHPDKKRPVQIVDFATRGTIEEQVLTLTREKKLDGEAVVDALKSSVWSV